MKFSAFFYDVPWRLEIEAQLMPGCSSRESGALSVRQNILNLKQFQPLSGGRFPTR